LPLAPQAQQFEGRPIDDGYAVFIFLFVSFVPLW